MTRSIFTLLTSSTTAAMHDAISRPPFINLKKGLTMEQLNSKFIVINGQEIPSVGAQIYLTFPQFPDAIYRAAYQATRSTTTPFVLVSFEKTDDKPSDIIKLLEALRPYLTDPKMMN